MVTKTRSKSDKNNLNYIQVPKKTTSRAKDLTEAGQTSKMMMAKMMHKVSAKDIMHLIATQGSKESLVVSESKLPIVEVKPRTPLGFGSTVPRGLRPPHHPKLDPTGLYTDRPLGCDPCLYHPKPLDKICDTQHAARKDPWRYKTELENWSLNIGYRNQHILRQRRWLKSIGGPAWTTVPEEVKYEPACKNVNFGRTPRFKTPMTEHPGPGTYYRTTPYKAPYGPHSTRPTFQREEPCRFKDTTTKWSLPPNIYRVLDKDSIENKPKKIVSRRGPYDLFTGKRDGTSIKNHFATNKCSAASWPIALPGCLNKYKKGHFGEMNKTGMDVPPASRVAVSDMASCRRNKSDPSPASYDIGHPPVREFVQNKKGFNSTYDRPPGYVRCIVWPGVGRYDVKTLTCGIAGHGHCHVFLSKVGRTIGSYIQEPMNSF